MRELRCTAVMLAAWLLLTAAHGMAQAPKPSLNVPTTEIFGGFLLTDPDYGPHMYTYPFYGVEVALSKGITEHLAVIGTVNYVSGSFRDVKQISATVGGKYNFRTGRYRPYGTAQLGYAYQHSHGLYAGDHNPPRPVGGVFVEDGLTYRIGGGLDIQITPRISWRVAQWDWQPQPWGRSTPIYQNFTSGIGWHF